MKRSFAGPLWSLLGLCASLSGLAVMSPAHADALATVQMLREGGCGGLVPAARPLHHDVTLDRAAAQWARGWPLAAATERSGYRAAATSALHVSGSDDFVIRQLRNSRCRAVAGRELRDVGIYERGPDTWLVLASVSAAADTAATASGGSMSAARALELVNEVRARGTRCGTQAFAAAPPLTLSHTLAGVAFGHAADMAEHDYFEHVDPAGQSPADRVRAAGYSERVVGENIAYGPESVDEVVKGWLGSPGHCANIMDPRFEQMGFAYAAGHGVRHGLYWVQVFAEPRA